MAIKVRHEGNATSRLAAGAAGGKGRRRSEEAKTLLQIASQEEIANRQMKTPQMVQAHATAPGSAPTISAPAGGNAPLMAAPSIPQARPVGNRGNGGFAPVVKMPSRKSAPAQLGKLIQTRTGPNPEWAITDGAGNIVRRYDKSQAENVKRRGQSGATMDDIDQWAYFRYNGGKTQQELEEEARQRKEADIADQHQREDEVFERNNKERDRRFQMEADARAVAARDKFEQNELRRGQEEERRNQEKLSAQAQAQRDKAAEQVIQGIERGDFTDDEIPQLIEQFKEYEERIRLADQLRRKAPTAQEQFDERRVTINGKEGYIGAKGDFIPFDDGREAELEAKRMDALRSRADKYELELMKPYKTVVGEGDEAMETWRERTPEEIEAIMRRKFPELYPAVDTDGTTRKEPPATPEGAQELPSIETAAAYAQYLSGEGTTSEARTDPPAQPAEQPATSQGPAVTVEDAKKKWGVK